MQRPIFLRIWSEQAICFSGTFQEASMGCTEVPSLELTLDVRTGDCHSGPSQLLYQAQVSPCNILKG